MTIEQMKERKRELGLTSEMIAEASGVPLSTVQKIFSGITKAPRRLTIKAIENVLREEQRTDRITSPSQFPETDGKAYSVQSGFRGARADAFRESAAGYSAEPVKERYTVKDYYALPEDQRMELIDGAFYNMGSPRVVHQTILGELYILFRECAEKHNLPCNVLLSPCDVRLDRDEYTMVQPDLLVLCGKIDIHAIRIEGAPDLVVEILSSSTRMKDMILKLHKYQNAGVREYWIVDPKHRTVTVHFFDTEDYDPQKYDFGDEIPVGISGEACKIDFSKVMERLEDYYDTDKI